jgi:hypothetical protein
MPVRLIERLATTVSFSEPFSYPISSYRRQITDRNAGHHSSNLLQSGSRN